MVSVFIGGIQFLVQLRFLGRGAKFRLSVIGDLVFTDVRTSFVLMFINKLEIVNCGNEPEGGVQRNLSETM